MTKTQNKATGKIGEDLAVEFLKDKGYEILERNWGNKWGEIDIICRDYKTTVFVEVKTKIGLYFGSPEEMINTKKLTRIQKIDSSYFKSAYQPVRIDIVTVILSDKLTPESIKHYRAVY